MTPSMNFNYDDSELDETTASRRGLPPEMQSRRAKSVVRTRARRNRSNEVAKRGMHQRRNKRTAW